MNSNTVFGTFHQMLATMILFVTNGHMLVLGGLLSTFRFLPVGANPDTGQATEVMLIARSGSSSSPRCRSRCR